MTAFSDETVLKRNEVLSFDDGLLTIKISGHGAGDGWGSIAFHERQIEIDADGFHVAEIPPSELRALRDFLNRVIKPAFSDETGRVYKRDVYIGVLASLAAAISLLERTPRSKKAAASDKMFDQMIADYKRALETGRAALSASPVAQEPVARLCGYCKTWNSKPCGEQCYLQPSDPVWTSPPATSAGLGADEIAQIIATKCFDPRVIDSSGKPFWKKSQWREAQQAANAILALLSRAGDQKRPHEA